VAEAEKKLAATRAEAAKDLKTAAERVSAPAPVPEPRARSIRIPAGTPVVIRTTSELSTNAARAGDPFDATLEEALTVNGTVVVPRRARVIGAVVSADKGGRVKGRAQLAVRVRSVVDADGRMIDLSTGSVGFTAEGSKKEDAVKIGIATGIGTAIGAIAGGGKGAAIGAGAGAGAGAGSVLLTRGDAAVLPAESVLRFETTEAVTVQR
jgi:hypothetical protein